MPTQNIYDLVDTWNDGATTFTAVKMNVTDTASNAASLLMDLQIGGVSKLRTKKDGVLQIPGTGLEVSTSSTAGTANRYLVASNAYYMWNGGMISWSSSSTDVLPQDLILSRRAAANLRFGAADAAAPVAQTLSVQSVVAGTSNTAGANLTITGSQGTGTGAGGSIIFQVAPAGSTGTAQNALATALTIGGDRFIGLNGTTGGIKLETSDGFNSVGLYSSGSLIGIFSQNNGLRMGSGRGISWSAATSPEVSSADLLLVRDAANTLALRNGTAAQGFNIYNTYTDASNYELGRLLWSGNNLYLQTLSGGTGSSRGIIIQSGNGNLTLSNTNLLFAADNTYDIGASGATRPRNVYIGGSIVVGDGGRISRQSGFGGIVFQSSNSVELGPGTGGTFATGANSAIRIVQPLTVATLPTPSTGMMARVTDALMPTMGTTVAGGGAAQALVWYNGANWTVIGV